MIVKTEQQYETNPEGVSRFYTTTYDPFGIESESPQGFLKVFLGDLPWHRPPGQVCGLRGECFCIEKVFHAPQS